MLPADLVIRGERPLRPLNEYIYGRETTEHLLLAVILGERRPDGRGTAESQSKSKRKRRETGGSAHTTVTL